MALLLKQLRIPLDRDTGPVVLLWLRQGTLLIMRRASSGQIRSECREEGLESLRLKQRLTLLFLTQADQASE
jgi:hypothetical protein